MNKIADECQAVGADWASENDKKIPKKQVKYPKCVGALGYGGICHSQARVSTTFTIKILGKVERVDILNYCPFCARKVLNIISDYTEWSVPDDLKEEFENWTIEQALECGWTLVKPIN